MSTTRIGIPSPQRWQHARGLRLEFAFFRPSVGNTFGGLRLEFAFFRPCIGNMLGGCASNWHSFAPALTTRSGAAPYNPMLATLGGYAYMLTLQSTIFVPGVSNTLGDSTFCC
jgi:hypothetical protein